MANDILDAIILNTRHFLEEMPKSERKKKGQFFTSRETAVFMASLFELDDLPEQIVVLDIKTPTLIQFNYSSVAYLQAG